MANRFVVLSCAVIVTALPTAVAGMRALLSRAVPIGSRAAFVLATLATLVVAYTSAAYSIPSIWKTGETGRAQFATRLRDAGISVQTTLGVYEVSLGSAEAVDAVLSDRSFASLLPETQAIWRGIAERTRPNFLMSLVDVPPRYAEFTRALAASLQRGGVRLIDGTDAMGLPMVPPGSSLLRELGLLTKSGLTPFEAVRTATLHPSQFLGKDDEFGRSPSGSARTSCCSNEIRWATSPRSINRWASSSEGAGCRAKPFRR